MAVPNPLQSNRLIYRAPEPDDEGDQQLYLALQQDPVGYQNSNARIPKPQSKARAKSFMNYVCEKTLLGVVMCLPPETTEGKPTPIGSLHLDQAPPHLSHHRNAEIGIDILPAYQGKGYGSEAIKWCLRWAFITAGLHKVELRAFSYNEGALRLYRRLGFVQEAVGRENIWFQGRFWDGIGMGILDREWRELEAKGQM